MTGATKTDEAGQPGLPLTVGSNDGLGVSVQKRAISGWKSRDCPTCKSKAGESCGRQQFGGAWWIRTAPHTARKVDATKTPNVVLSGAHAEDGEAR